jgi:hypothetical protein
LSFLLVCVGRYLVIRCQHGKQIVRGAIAVKLLQLLHVLRGAVACLLGFGSGLVSLGVCEASESAAVAVELRSWCVARNSVLIASEVSELGDGV